ncbi:MAG: ArsC family transcriptional regulator [candidate division Zixibacteria bacterium]|nr:ArsC family transcriptional regulator [candidate division Zixibacteria bacterium]
MIQIFGTRKCKETRKAERFFKERGINFQFIDLKVKEISKGELNSISRSIPLVELIDKDGKEYENRNLKYIKYNIEEELLENPLLFKTPIIRNGQQAINCYDPEILKKWAEEEKQ